MDGFCLDIELNKLVVKRYFWDNYGSMIMDWVLENFKRLSLVLLGKIMAVRWCKKIFLMLEMYLWIKWYDVWGWF